MGSPVTSADFRRLVEGHVRNVSVQALDFLPSRKTDLFNVMDSDRPYEDFYDITGVPDIPDFGGKVSYLSISPGWYTKIEPRVFAGGIQFERTLLDDEQYGVLAKRAQSLAEAANRTMVKHEVRPFAYAFSSAFEFHTSEEGVALCSNSHTNKSGASTSTGFDNLGTSALSKTSVAAARLALRQFRSDIGERYYVGDDLCLIVPDALEEEAWEITNTKIGKDTAEGNMNFHAGRYEIITLPLLDDFDSNNWFLAGKSRMKEDLIWIDRVKPDPSQEWDLDSFILKLVIYFRIAYGWRGWRWVFGNQVS